MKLVPDWKDSWKWNSVQVFALIAALPAIWAGLPPEVQAMVPADWQMWIVQGMAVIGMIARIRQQGLP